MVDIEIKDKQGIIRARLQSSFVPEVGEYVWMKNDDGSPYREMVEGRTIEVDEERRRFNVTLHI